MADNILARLTLAGILERSGRRRSVLRVSPRFMAHAEGTSGRLRLSGHGPALPVLEVAVRTWDEYHGDAASAARFLEAMLGERHQLGALRPVFPALDQFARAAA
jgi:hypothetical protein